MRTAVILTVRNGVEFVGAAIESLLAQTRPASQFIVVDDGSTDATPAALARFGSRLTVVRHENRGLPAGRNGALALTDADAVAFLDHDDLWEPTFLERTVGRLAAAGDHVAGAVAGWTRIDRSGREMPGTRILPRGILALRDLLPGCPFPTGATVLRRRAVVEQGGFDPTLRVACDWDLWLRLATAGWQFAAVEEALWHYRLHQDNFSSDPSRLRGDALRLLGKLFAHPGLPPDVSRCGPRAVGTAYFHASERFYALGRPDAGADDFVTAVRTCPELLQDDETYYAVICADQPPGDKASARHLDLVRGEGCILHALSACAAAAVTDAATQRRALGRAYRALAALAFGQRRMGAVRHYARRALRADPALWSDRRTLLPALKSLAGAPTVDTLSRWRRRAGARLSPGTR